MGYIAGDLKVTELEYQTALELSRDTGVPAEDSAAFWQLARYYRGQICLMDEAKRALEKLRGPK